MSKPKRPKRRPKPRHASPQADRPTRYAADKAAAEVRKGASVPIVMPRTSKAVYTRSEKITPQRALKFLESQRANRPYSQTHAEMLARDMIAGKYVHNGETIKIDRDGHLVDGQHRCWAVIIAEKDIESEVAYNVDPSEWTMMTIDNNRVRSFSDDLALLGRKQVAALGSVTRLIWNEKNLDTPFPPNKRGTPSNPELHALLKTQETRVASAVSAVGSARSQGDKLLSPNAVVVFAYLKFRDIDAEQAKAWLAKFVTGADLSLGCPIRAARNFLIRKRDETKGGGIPREVHYAVLIKSWNMTRAGITRRVFKVPPVSPVPVPK